MKQLHNLSYWTVSRLESMNSKTLLKLTRRAFGRLSQSRLLVGRCLLVMRRTEACQQHGYSGGLHFCNWSGLEMREGAEARRVAERLEALPLLRDATEQGRIAWSQVREITRKATVETEERWLNLARKCSYKEIERIVARTREGEPPQGPEAEGGAEPEFSELRVTIPSQVMAMLQQVVRELSHEERRLVSMAQVLEILAAEHLAGGGLTPAALEKLRAEARRDVAAARELELRGWEGNRSGADEGPGRGADDPAGRRADNACGVELVDWSRAGAGDPCGSGADDPPDDPCGSAPWAALAAREEVCPEEPAIKLVQPDRPHWQNPRLCWSGIARMATPAQRRELLRRDGYRCSTPGCPNHLWLAVHHVVFYCVGGVTVPANLVVVCGACHRNIHRGLLRVRRSSEGALEWSNRHGQSLSESLLAEDSTGPDAFG